MNYINKYDAFRIGKQGRVSEGQFKFKARSDCHELSIKQDYQHNDSSDQNQLAQILMFRFLDGYLRSFNLEKSISLSSCVEIMLSVDHAHENHKISWDPMVSGTRLLKYLYVKCVLADDIDKNLLKRLSDRINYTINRLSSIKYHNSNHYLQGLHALVAASVLEDRKDLEHFRDLAVSMFCELFNEEGFYKENSSEYHFYAINMIKDFDSCDWYRSDQLNDILEKADGFSPLLFASVGEIFAFGDTDRDLIRRQVNRGVIDLGDFENVRINVRPETGIVRSSSDNKYWASELMLVNFYHGHSHNHHDYCAFEWFVNGNWILLDPGKFSYNQSKKSEYFYKDKSHNTINLSSFGHDFKKSLKYVDGNECFGFNRVEAKILDENFMFSRLLDHGPNHITIRDSLVFQKAVRKSKVISSFNISPDFYEVEQGSDKELLFISKKFKLRVSSDVKLNFLSGNESPYIGWISEKYNTAIPCWYVYLDLSSCSNLVSAEVKFEIVNF